MPHRQPEPVRALPQSRNLLRRPAFTWLLAGRSLSLLGSAMTPVALGFAVLDASDSAGDLSLVLTARTVSLVALILAGGAIADRVSRGKVLAMSFLGAGLTQGAVAAVLLSGHYDLGTLLVLQVLSGGLEAFATPALRGIVPDLVPKGQTQKANALLSSAKNATRVAGPSLAGALVVTFGGGWAIAFDGLMFLAAAVCMTRLRLPAHSVAHVTGVLTDIREGWREFRSTTWVWTVTASYSVMNCIQVGVWNILGIIIAKETIGEVPWGVVLSVRAVGLLVVTAVMYRLVVKRLLPTGQIASALAALPLVALGLHADVYVLAVAAFVAGLGTGMGGIAWDTSLQEHVDNRKLSRFAAYDDLGSYLSIPLGQLAVVPLAAQFGDGPVAVSGGALYLLVALLPLAVPSVRGLRHGR